MASSPARTPPQSIPAVRTADNGASGNSSANSDAAEINCVSCHQPFFSKDITPARAQKPWKCNGCQQWFTVKSSAKRHATNVHPSRICRDCGGGTETTAGQGGTFVKAEPVDIMEAVAEPVGITDTEPQHHAQRTFMTTNASNLPIQITMAHPPQPQQQSSVASALTITNPGDYDLQADLSLLSLMLQNNLDLKTMDNIIVLLNSGRDFSKIKNAAHWLERLGRGAAVNVTTNCNTCKKPATQACFTNGHSTHMAPVFTAITTTPIIKGMPPIQNAVTSVPFPSGTVIGIFDAASGQLLPAMGSTSTVVATPVSAEQTKIQLPPSGQSASTSSRTKAKRSAGGATSPIRPAPPSGSNANAHSATPGKVGSVATSWKAIARSQLYGLHTAADLLTLCVVGRRVDKTQDSGLQPMDTEKRRQIADAVSQHCNSVGIPVPGETQLNHFMSQILCDLRRKENMQAQGITPTRNKKMKKEAPPVPEVSSPSSLPV